MKKRIRKHRLVEPEYNKFEVIVVIYRERVNKGLIKLKVGDVCPHCVEDNLQLAFGVEPYTINHLQCPTCDSTYNL